MVWIPRYRKEVLVRPVEARLKELLAEIATQYGFEILAVEVTPVLAAHEVRLRRCASVSDPVHLFVSAPPKFAPAEIVGLFKGITSRRLKKEFESLRRQYWAEGYYVGTAGHVSAETTQRYIEESQKNQFQVLKA